MNFKPLSDVHGAPLRLRVENQLGFKMVKWIKAIEFVADRSSTCTKVKAATPRTTSSSIPWPTFEMPMEPSSEGSDYA